MSKKLLVITLIILIFIGLYTNYYHFENQDGSYDGKKKFIPKIDAGEDIVSYTNITIKFNVSLNNVKNKFKYYSWDYDSDGIEDENVTYSISEILVNSLYESSNFCYKKPGNYIATVTIVDRNDTIAHDSCNVTILPHSLEFEIEANKLIYNISEPIIILSKLKNNNNADSVNVENMMLLRGSLEFFITTPENYTLTYLGYYISLGPTIIEIKPNSYYVVETEITNSSYFFGNISYGGTKYKFDSKGEYDIKVLYKAYFNQPDTWQGELVSNIVKIWIE